MPDYIYLLENRLSVVQQNALRTVRDLAREAQMTVFLTGDAVRDLTCGNPVRDLEVAVYGNALELRAAIENAGGSVWGEYTESRTLFLCFPGSVRLDLVSTHRAEFPKPGQPVYQWASIQEDLRARDFTVNAMAISLNEGSYGLLMDPTNGVADIEARLLRLVSNYGFLDDPIRLIRASRLKSRLGFEMEDRTLTRYENAKGDELVEHVSAFERSRELEQVGHEEDPLKVLKALEADGWMQHLFPAWTSAKADVEKLNALHDLSIELQVQGIHPDVSAAQMQLLTAKVAPKDLAELKSKLLRRGFVEEWNLLDAKAAEFAKVLLSKESATPSASYNLFMSYAPEAVLWLGFTTKQAAVKEKYENFLKVWPQARQRIPYPLMLEMRITPELPGYLDLVKSMFLQLIDGGLTTNDEIRALLEPHSPPAPPPPVTIKRTRVKKGADAKAKARLADEDDEDADELDGDEDAEDDDDIDGLDLDNEDLDFTIAADDARAVQPAAEGEEDDVFARNSVGDDLDMDDDSDDSDADLEEDAPGRSGKSDDSDDDPPPSRSGGKGSKSGSKSAGKLSTKGTVKAPSKAGRKASISDSSESEMLSQDESEKAKKVPGSKTVKAGKGIGASLSPAAVKPISAKAGKKR